MALRLEIPESVARAMRLPLTDQRRQLKAELAVSLYAQSILSFGKACELADMSRTEFGLMLHKRNIARHYDKQDLKDDVAYARGQ